MPRKPKVYLYKNKDWTLRELEQISPVGKRTIQKRLESGWSIDRAVEESKYSQDSFEIATSEEAYRGCTEEQLPCWRNLKPVAKRHAGNDCPA